MTATSTLAAAERYVKAHPAQDRASRFRDAAAGREALGIGYRTLLRRMKKYGIDLQDRPPTGDN